MLEPDLSHAEVAGNSIIGPDPGPRHDDLDSGGEKPGEDRVNAANGTAQARAGHHGIGAIWMRGRRIRGGITVRIPIAQRVPIIAGRLLNGRAAEVERVVLGTVGRQNAQGDDAAGGRSADIADDESVIAGVAKVHEVNVQIRSVGP